MAFKKLYSVIQDSPVGFNTVNQAALNSDEMRTQMYVEHGSRDPTTGPTQPGIPDYSRRGRHDLQEIARTAGRTILVAQPNLTFQATLAWTGIGVPFVARISQGLYYLPVAGLSKWWAVPQVFAGVSTTYLPPQMRSFYPTPASPGSGIWASTYSLDTGDFVPIDAAFSFVLYGVV